MLARRIWFRRHDRPRTGRQLLFHPEEQSLFRRVHVQDAAAKVAAHLQTWNEAMLKKIAIAALAATLSSACFAQQTTGVDVQMQTQVLNTLPSDSTTVANFYKQNVYNPDNTKVGEIADVLLGRDGKVNAFIISVGGFLGIGEKDIAVPFTSIHATEKNGTWYLTINATKDTLKEAHGYKYNKARGTWTAA
jgi:sporulation protein YlmC with PRC-barrel domain